MFYNWLLSLVDFIRWIMLNNSATPLWVAVLVLLQSSAKLKNHLRLSIINNHQCVVIVKHSMQNIGNRYVSNIIMYLNYKIYASCYIVAYKKYYKLVS